jgi:DNA repair protein SbcC/Rad50
VIPVRVSLRNFLCYDDLEGEPLEFDFDGSSLWSISGDNGAGKSAIFDAITYTLFGQHRGGSQRDSRLIRRGANTCEAQFDFLLDGQLYRIRRTVGRPRRTGGQESKTRQASWFDSDADDWRPIPDTDRETELSTWVEQKLGFGYETFIASVVLLQGQSDRLITEKPPKRFEILSGILEMEAYKRLEDAASRHTSDARKELNVLEQQLSGLTPVPEGDLKAAVASEKSTTKLLNTAQTALQEALALKADAGRYEAFAAESKQIRERLAQLAALLKRAKQVRGKYQEWLQLSNAVPLCRRALDELDQARIDLEASASARKMLASLDLNTLRKNVEERQSAVKDARSKEQNLRRIHQETSRALPKLKDLLRCRRELIDREAQALNAGSPDDLQTRLQEAQAELDTKQTEHEEAEKASRAASEELAEAAAALQQAQRQLSARRDAKGEAVCSRCGQRVTDEHIQQEIDDCEKAVAQAQLNRNTEQESANHAKRALESAKEPLKRLANNVSEAKLVLGGAVAAAKEKDKAADSLRAAIAEAGSMDAKLLQVLIKEPMQSAEASVADMVSSERAAKQELEEAEETTRSADDDLSKAQQTYDGAVGQSQKLQQTVTQKEEHAKGLRANAEVRLGEMNFAWKQRTLAADTAFVDELEDRLRSLDGAEAENRELDEAESEGARLRTREELVKQETEKIPAAHRVSVEIAAGCHVDAETKLKEAQRARDDARSNLQRLEEASKRWAALEDQANAARRRRVLYARLADLLGRSGLQAHLMDAALEGIDRLANETLARISGGQLQVRLVREPNAKGEEEITIRALDLASSDEPLDIQFISGGQKFRTSVALAAGIGQYAGGSKDSVRSLIIDEGFGSLDSHGRQEMIEELQNLSQLMDRIIVVSHQEDFQDRTLFPTGYVLRKTGQKTTVEKFV